MILEFVIIQTYVFFKMPHNIHPKNLRIICVVYGFVSLFIDHQYSKHSPRNCHPLIILARVQKHQRQQMQIVGLDHLHHRQTGERCVLILHIHRRFTVRLRFVHFGQLRHPHHRIRRERPRFPPPPPPLPPFPLVGDRIDTIDAFGFAFASVVDERFSTELAVVVAAVVAVN